MNVSRILLLLLLLPLVLVVSPCSAENEAPLVVCTTSVLGSIVEDLAGDTVEVVVIASPSICPAHYDIRPSDVYAVGAANLILYHGFEPWLNDTIEASGSTAPQVQVSGPWNTPDGARQYYQSVADALQTHLGIDVGDRLTHCLAAINATEAELQSEAQQRAVSEWRVICMQWQSGFVSWLGFNITTTYPPPERLSASDIADLIEQSREAGVRLVIDNLQSGTEVGAQIASEIGAVHVVLSNFPNTAPGLNNLTQLLRYNAEQLFAAMDSYEYLSAAQQYQREAETWRWVAVALLIVAVAEALALIVRWRR